MYGNIIASPGLCGCEIWSLPVGDHRLSVLDIRGVWRFLEFTREDETEECIMRNLVIFILHQCYYLGEQIKENKMQDI
jgi:hypothetical protein